MRIVHIRNAGILALTTAMFIGLPCEAQEGQAFDAATRPASEAGPGRRARRTGMQPSEHILSAQLQATVYEVQGAAERLGSLDDKALTGQATTPERLLSALAQTGKVRMLYRIDQPVNVFSTTSMIGSSEPVVTGTRTTAAGNALNRISYQNLGLIIRLSAQAAPKDETNAPPTMKMAIQLSVLSPGEKEIAPGQKELAVRAVSLDHSEALALNQPRVLLAISSNAMSGFQRSAEGGGKAETQVAPVAYVVRYQFGPPAQGGGAGAAASPAGSAAKGSAPARMSTTAPETARSANNFTAQFQATVYEVEATTNLLPTLDHEALAGAATSELLFSALGNIGKPRVLYRIDQAVNVFSDQVQITTNTPVAVGTRMGRDEKPINSYTYHNTGVRIALSDQAPPKDAGREGPDVMISFNMSTDVPSHTELGLGQPTRAFVTISQEHNEPLELGRPRVMLAIGSPSAAEQATPFVYVVRYQFGPPEAR